MWESLTALLAELDRRARDSVEAIALQLCASPELTLEDDNQGVQVC